MNQLTNPIYVKSLMQRHKIQFQKSLGQNFLIEEQVLTDIVEASQLDETTGVIEIGPGIGVLTQALAPHTKKLVAIELDRGLLPVLAETLAPFENTMVIHGDALKVDLKTLIEEAFQGLKVKVIANLPYYITTPIIMELLEKKLPLQSIVVMIQKEVAERMVASPGGKDYGALSVAVQYYANPIMIRNVPPHCFIPQPKVDSTVIRLDILPEPSVTPKNEKIFFRVIKAAFAQRRKTLLNALSNSGAFKQTKDEMKEILLKMSLNENARGETLSLAQFSTLSDHLN